MATITNWLSLVHKGVLQGSFKRFLTGSHHCSPLPCYQKPHHTHKPNTFYPSPLRITYLRTVIKLHIHYTRQIFTNFIHIVTKINKTKKLPPQQNKNNIISIPKHNPQYLPLVPLPQLQQKLQFSFH